MYVSSFSDLTIVSFGWESKDVWLSLQTSQNNIETVCPYTLAGELKKHRENGQVCNSGTDVITMTLNCNQPAIIMVRNANVLLQRTQEVDCKEMPSFCKCQRSLTDYVKSQCDNKLTVCTVSLATAEHGIFCSGGEECVKQGDWPYAPISIVYFCIDAVINNN